MTISGFQDLGILQGVKITKQMCAHSRCTFDLLLDKEVSFSSLYERIGETVSVENEKRLLLYGKVESISGKQTYLKTTLSITLVSCSEKLDKEKKNRIYQSTQKTYGDMTACLEQENIKLSFSDATLAKKVETKVITQYHQTDFEFLATLASELEVPFWVNDTNRKDTTIYIGEWMDKHVKEIEPEKIAELEFDLEEAGDTIKARIDGFYEVGSLMRIEGFDYLVTALTIEAKNQTEYYYYELKRKEKIQTKENVCSLNPLGKARVVDNRDPDKLGRLQVEFLELEDILP